MLLGWEGRIVGGRGVLWGRWLGGVLPWYGLVSFYVFFVDGFLFVMRMTITTHWCHFTVLNRFSITLTIFFAYLYSFFFAFTLVCFELWTESDFLNTLTQFYFFSPIVSKLIFLHLSTYSFLYFHIFSCSSISIDVWCWSIQCFSELVYCLSLRFQFYRFLLYIFIEIFMFSFEQFLSQHIHSLSPPKIYIYNQKNPLYTKTIQSS